MIFKKDPNRLKIMQIAFLTSLDENVMRDLLTASSVYVDHVKEQASISAREIGVSVDLSDVEKEQLHEFLVDDIHVAEEAKALTEELAIIGLHKTIEIRIDQAINIYSLQEKSYRGSVIPSLKDIGIDVQSISNFSEFNELRLLSNCLKHSGEVDEKLHKANGTDWPKEKAEIKDCAKHFHRLLIPSIQFLANIGNEINSKIKSTTHSE